MSIQVRDENGEVAGTVTRVVVTKVVTWYEIWVYLEAGFVNWSKVFDAVKSYLNTDPETKAQTCGGECEYNHRAREDNRVLVYVTK